MRRPIRMTFAAVAIAGVMAAAPAVARAGCLWEQSVPQPIDEAFPAWTAVVSTSASDTWLFGDSPAGMEHWNGSGWTGTASPLHPLAADATMADDVWQVGVVPGTETADSLHFDGSAWSEVPMVNPDGGVTKLDAVSAVSPTLAYAGGSFSAAHQHVSAIERWDGTAWTHAPRAPAINVTQLAAISRHDIWAVLQYPKDGLSSTALGHWDGHAWTTVRPYPAGDFVTLMDVSARARDDVWAVGGTPTAPVTYHYDGVSWTQVPVPSFTRNAGLRAVSAVKGAATIAVGNLMSKPLILRYARGAWHVEHSAINPGLGFRDVAAVPGSTEAWAFGGTVVTHRPC